MKHLPIAQAQAFVREDLCTPCGGVCCQNYPGASFPSDFGPPEKLQENLLTAFLTGRWIIAGKVLSDGREACYVHPTFKGQEHIEDPIYWATPLQSVCTFWSSQAGCEIFQTRPQGCRGLQPLPALKCKVRYGSEEQAAHAWLPYQKLLQDLLSLFQEM